MAQRRSLGALLRAIEEADTTDGRALAHFDLAVFHDNNGREAEAVPHYESALGLGLDNERNAEALAWLASSLFKTGRPQEALKRLMEARNATQDESLVRFLVGLERRVNRKLAKQ